MCRIHNHATHKAVNSRNDVTFLGTLAYSPVTLDVQKLLDEMEGIKYATDVSKFTYPWDNAQNSSIAEPKAQDTFFYLVRDARRRNARLQTQLDAIRGNSGFAGVAPVEPVENPTDEPE